MAGLDTPTNEEGSMKQANAEILREYGPFDGVERVHGVTFDGQHVWFASDGQLNALDPASGETMRTLKVGADAGTAFDGQYLFQIADSRIQKSTRPPAVY
jgi:hypothetical protein